MSRRSSNRGAGPGAWRDHPLVQLTLLRVREFVREPEALFWTLAFPILLSTGLGVAFRNEAAQPVPIAAVTPALASSLAKDPLLMVRELAPDAAAGALRAGAVLLVAEPASSGEIVFRYDDTNPDARTARMIVEHAVQVAAGRADPVTVRNDLVREPGSRYIDFLVPGLVALGIMSNALWMLGFSVVDTRRRKLLKRLVATPMPRTYYLLSYLVWRKLLLIAEVGVPVIFGVVAFDVPLRGSILELIGIAVLGSLAFSALGLLVASRARTIEAISGMLNLVMMPMWILSGVFFSAQRFPDAVQPWIKALPLSALVDALRANMLQGTSVLDMGRELGALAVCLVVSFALAMKLFRWR